MSVGRWQFIWWGFKDWTGFGKWEYLPKDYRRIMDYVPHTHIFTGYCFGLFEIRKMTRDEDFDNR